MDRDSLPRWKHANMEDSASSSLLSLDLNSKQRHDRLSLHSGSSLGDSTLLASSSDRKKQDGYLTPDVDYPLLAPRLYSPGVEASAHFSDYDDDCLVSIPSILHCLIAYADHEGSLLSTTQKMFAHRYPYGHQEEFLTC